MVQTLQQLESKIYKFIGYLDHWDRDEIVQKFNSVVSCARLLTQSQRRNDIVSILKDARKIYKAGWPDVTSEHRIVGILHKTRELVKGMRFALTPREQQQYLEDELLDVYYDPHTNTTFVEDDTDLASVLYDHPEDLDRPEIDALIGNITQLHLDVQKDICIDLGEGMEGFVNSSKAKEVESERIQNATRHYFEPTHQSNTLDIATVSAMLDEAERVVDANRLKASGVIIATVESLRSAHLCQKPLENHEEQIKWAKVDISLSWRPSQNNKGNLFIRNVGRYGYRKADGKNDVLDIFGKIISYSGESTFSTVISRYGHSPDKINLAMLRLPDNKQGQQLLNQLKYCLFLIFCAEIFRYFPIEQEQDSIPFAMALAFGLQLLEAGEITLDELFQKDAIYGLPTGAGIVRNPDKVAEKWQKLLEKYRRFADEFEPACQNFRSIFPSGATISEASEYVKFLEKTFGATLNPNV